MAANTYPRIGSKPWVVLQAKAVAAPSTRFTANFVATLLEMANPNSAQTNVVGALGRFGLIDGDGVLTERGNKWRGSESYALACQEILDEFYPPELANLVDDTGQPDVAKLKRWFENEGFGEANARQMANTYALVARKQLPEPSVPDPDKPKQAVAKPAKARVVDDASAVAAYEPPSQPDRRDIRPTLHLDIQIHLPADATPDQIDQIFSSMARHLYAK